MISDKMMLLQIRGEIGILFFVSLNPQLLLILLTMLVAMSRRQRSLCEEL